MELSAKSIGAEPASEGVHFRVWAPDHSTLSVDVEGHGTYPLHRVEAGYFSGLVTDIPHDARYLYRFANGETLPDPASRFQPEGPVGPSQVVDARRYRWSDHEWMGRPLEEFVIYEMHIGTFTSEGTWQAALFELKELASVGITCIELMPVAEFPGRWGWGYDGVDLFAPFHHYGTPDDFRAFVDEAHRLHLCVIVDVVYNHLGPDGNHLKRFASAYFSKEHSTDWGEAINFDGLDCGPVREFFLANAEYWIVDFHLDGLRLDATQDIHDDTPSKHHILTEIGRRVREAAPRRTIIIIAENEPQVSNLCRLVDQGGNGLDALWNDDFHHAAVVAMTGRREAYYSDYRGNPQEFVSAAKFGFLYQGQWYSWQDASRGQPALDLEHSRFVTFLQNHDQVANSGRGLRAHRVTNPGLYRTFTALLLLGPGTPMLFQGQEFAASSPFYYFVDHHPELAQMVEAGRHQFLSQFPSLQDPDAQRLLAPVADPQTFHRCKLDFAERQTNAPLYQLTKDLLTLRRHDPSFRAVNRRSLEGAVIAPQAFVLRYLLHDGQDRLLVVNLGSDLHLRTIPEPLLGVPRDCRWHPLLSTDNWSYGGNGMVPIQPEGKDWVIPGLSATFMAVAASESTCDDSNRRLT